MLVKLNLPSDLIIPIKIEEKNLVLHQKDMSLSNNKLKMILTRSLIQF